MPVRWRYLNAKIIASPYGHTNIRSIKFWHAVAGAGIGDMAVGPRSGAGVLYRTYARSVGFHAARYVRP